MSAIALTGRVCRECGIGRIRPTTAPFIIDYMGQPLVVPQAPAHACDVCRYLSYDTAFLFEFDHLMGQYGRDQSAESVAAPIVVTG